MSAALSDIYAKAPLRRLLAAEVKELSPEIQRCRGDHGLLISVMEDDCPPALPMLSCWTHLRLATRHYQGDVLARSDEALPFVDDAFELIILRHVLEASVLPQSVLDEAVRVLSPGGLLVLSGIHPVSLWAPWITWCTRQRPLRLRLPLQLGAWLRRAAMRVESVRRLGNLWPGTADGLDETGLGGGYLLLARKHRSAAAPVRLVPRSLRPAVDAELAPGARRNSA